MPPYNIENTQTRHNLSQEAVPAIRTRGGIARRGFYHFPPAHNRTNGPFCFKRTRIIRDLQQGAYCIRACLQYSTLLDWKVIEWEHQYIKLNDALFTAIFRLRYLRLRICEGDINNSVIIWFDFICHCKRAIHKKKERIVKGNSQDSVGVRKESGSQRCVLNKAHRALGTILDSKLLSFKWQEAVSDILSASKQSDPSPTWE
ncbi:hypothetical protein O181_093064 [Austropuccinia psidii MF-1]|uniref:Uncharacterized protein n=1 Tax=Austropuccinia psidii MF-1 TaxID=1389203 RepID=A0A9Q3J0H5_9BASI|nr:hypothetical protein [Austropuccinia psidii MF-1]